MSVLSFTWKGVSSDSHGICVKKLPTVYSPETRNYTYTVPNRDGILRFSENALEEYALLLDCYLPYEQGGTVSSLSTIRAWLRGEGWFTQSDIPDRAFYATGVVIDSEKMDVFAADGTTLANNIASMDSFPILTVGANAISYTGSVTSVSVLPRWRDI